MDISIKVTPNASIPEETLRKFVEMVEAAGKNPDAVMAALMRSYVERAEVVNQRAARAKRMGGAAR